MMRTSLFPPMMTWTVICATACAAASAAIGATLSGQVMLDGIGAEPAMPAARAVVYLGVHPNLAREASHDAAADAPQPQIIQRGKAFVPDLLVVSQGTIVEFPNWDPFSHNVFSRSRAASFDLDRYRQGQSKSYTFQNVGVVQIFCNIHPHMKAVVVVVPNDFYTLSDARGRFTFEGVPPGEYALLVWHERSGQRQQTVHVPPEGLTRLSMTLPAGSVPREAAAPVRRFESVGVERGLGVKRERLNLPTVGGVHPAPAPQRRN